MKALSILFFVAGGLWASSSFIGELGILAALGVYLVAAVGGLVKCARSERLAPSRSVAVGTILFGVPCSIVVLLTANVLSEEVGTMLFIYGPIVAAMISGVLLVRIAD